MSARAVVAGLGVTLTLVLAGCGASPGTSSGSGPSRAATGHGPSAAAGDASLAPSTVPAVPMAGRTLFGVHPDWATDDPAGYVARTGLHPAVYGDFAAFPVTAGEAAHIRATAALVRRQGAALFLTLEPKAGLASVTPGTAAAAATVLAEVNAGGVPVYLRFAHEMNGSWYAWGQQPAAYVAAFRTVAAAVHAAAPRTYLVWAPNYGSGYPFTGGAHSAVPGSADHALLDTDHDGTLTVHDDMYAPYYPGDASVDWVGLTLYFFGLQYPWNENEVPDAGRFVAQLSGDYHSRYGDERAIPDFYARYAVGHDRPMVLAETAAWFNTGRTDGAAQGTIEKAWLDQVFSPQVRTRFPRLAMVNWFEHSKVEDEAHGVVDWRLTFNPGVLADLKAELATGAPAYVFATG